MDRKPTPHLDELDPITRQMFRNWIGLPQNKWVWRAFKVKCFEMHETGRKKYSAKTIVENIRWDYDKAHPGQEFLIDNNFTSCLARAMADNYPQFSKFFEFRTLTGITSKRAA